MGRGLVFACAAIAFLSMSPNHMAGRYENRADRCQWVEFKGAKAHVFTPANPERTKSNEEILDYERKENRVIIFSAARDWRFEVKTAMLIVDADGVAWDRKYNND